ncbi:MMPL family transporter [Mesobacillus subterraneus]|uniref:efflux RND transporter permease subunit n=1 Tax=Mesobacillus subterraneus TaxID=285983 RepID=UPI00203DE75E|nr:MMPL family transporter [Mesobacillus subterraneus]MCM3573474.1 MMPL family transporter [Mesobacillus subterraneus]
MNNKPKKALNQTLTKMVPAVLTALIATGLGFIALYTSPVPMVQDFGKMLTVGMIISFIAGVLILIPILFTRDHFFKKERVKQKQVKLNNKKGDRFFNWFTNKLILMKWFIVLVAFISAGFGIWADLKAGVETDVEKFMPQDTQELKDIHKLREILGSTDQISVVYEAADVSSAELLEWVDGVTGTVKSEFPETIIDTRSVTTALRQMNKGEFPVNQKIEEYLAEMPESQKKLLINEEGTKGVITLSIEHLEAEELKGFIDDLIDYFEGEELKGVDTTVTGKAVLDAEMVTALTAGRYKMTLLGMGLVFFGLLLVYRHPVKAFIPLLPIALIVGWSGGAMFLLDIKYTPLTATLGALIIGIGTEFTILIMERFYEERKKGRNSNEAIVVTNRKTGKAILASAFTTIGGFSALLISDFVILSNFGLMTLINISLALFSTIVVMPAILIILDRFVKIRHVGENELPVN